VGEVEGEAEDVRVPDPDPETTDEVCSLLFAMVI
jgi:hypothetical protein